MTVFRSRGALVRNYRAKMAESISNTLDGLMIVFNNQRDDEIVAENTYHKNRVGFNKSDAKVLSKIAKDKLDGKDLDEQQIAEINRRMPKYARQIVKSMIRFGKYVKRDGIYVAADGSEL